MIPIPKSAPFAEEEIALLNRVMEPASPVQRAWLAGFLAGIDHTAANEQPAQPPRAAEPLTIVFASKSGNSEALAGDVAKQARKLGFKPRVLDMAELDLNDLAKAKRLIVIAATWGEGEFCAIGKAVDERLAALGGKRVVDRIDCDLDFAEPASTWIGGALKALAPEDDGRGRVIEVDFTHKPAAAATSDIVEAEVIEHVNLNSSRSEKETVHLALQFDGAAPAYEPGSSLDLYAENDSAYVDELMALAKVSDDGLRGELIASRDVTTLSLKSLETFMEQTGHAEAKALIDGGAVRGWIAGRQLIDLVEAFPLTHSAEGLRALTRPLSPRAYSIASSRREFEDEAHVLISAVRYNLHGRARRGVASTYVAERLKRGDRVRVKVKPNKHFALPSLDRDIIMVGPGTGVAPFRAFVQERRATEATGKSWLFFGDRSFTHDFLYQLDWQEALKDGALTRMDVAFSRDRPQKTYVQQKLWERRRELVDWLEGGAYFYVCGDAKAMAKDVRTTLTSAYADVKALSPEAAAEVVAKLEREKRYLQDVY